MPTHVTLGRTEYRCLAGRPKRDDELYEITECVRNVDEKVLGLIVIKSNRKKLLSVN
jgi:hypothetical protein